MSCVNIKNIIGELPGTIEFAHIGYIVEDRTKHLDSFFHFYGVSSFLCYDYVPDISFADGRRINDCRLKLAVGKSVRFGFSVELIEPVSGDTPHRRYLECFGTHLNHMAFMVSDYEAYREAFLKIADHRIEFEGDFTDLIKGRRRSFYVTAPVIAGILEITEKPILK